MYCSHNRMNPLLCVSSTNALLGIAKPFKFLPILRSFFSALTKPQTKTRDDGVSQQSAGSYNSNRLPSNNCSHPWEDLQYQWLEMTMEALLENLTTNEAAIAAGVTVAKINRVIDRKILPEKVYNVSERRTVR